MLGGVAEVLEPDVVRLELGGVAVRRRGLGAPTGGGQRVSKLRVEGRELRWASPGAGLFAALDREAKEPRASVEGEGVHGASGRRARELGGLAGLAGGAKMVRDRLVI